MVNEAITNMNFEDIEKLTSDETKQFEDFKYCIESYNQSLQRLIMARKNLEHEINQKKSYFETSRKDIPLKVYLRKVSPIVLIGILSSYIILTINDITVVQSYIRGLIFLLNSVIVLCALFFPLLVLPKNAWEN